MLTKFALQSISKEHTSELLYTKKNVYLPIQGI